MKYKKASDILPIEIIEKIQEYIDGDFLYIPRKDINRKKWGEKSGIKETLQKRNKEIYKKYISGVSINKLTEEYYLSDKSIRRIIKLEKH